MSDNVDMTEELGDEAFHVDFSKIQDLGPVEEGVYDASIVKATRGMSQSGNPKIDLQWRVEGGETDGRYIFDMLSFHPNALGVTKAKLQGLGYPEDWDDVIRPEDLVGVTASLVVTVQPSDQINPATGEVYPPRNRVNRIRQGDVDLEAIL